MANPKSTNDRIHAFIAAWEQQAPTVTLADHTLAQFKAKVKDSLDARDEIENLALQLDAARVNRDDADLESDELMNDVVNAVKADSNFGDNSALYASLGYVRKSERKSGLTRAARNAAAANPGLKVAA